MPPGLSSGEPWESAQNFSMEKPDLASLLTKWQRILRLQDWEIKVEWARHFDMLPDSQGQVKAINAHKTAYIKILDRADLADPAKACSSAEEAEVTLVHELLHLHFSLIDGFSGTDNVLYEQAISTIAKALIDRDRKPL
jgi:hypothetical protein